MHVCERERERVCVCVCVHRHMHHPAIYLFSCSKSTSEISRSSRGWSNHRSSTTPAGTWTAQKSQSNLTRRKKGNRNQLSCVLCVFGWGGVEWMNNFLTHCPKCEACCPLLHFLKPTFVFSKVFFLYFFTRLCLGVVCGICLFRRSKENLMCFSSVWPAAYR